MILMSKRYINAQDVIDWLDDNALPPGENAGVDLLVEKLVEHLRDSRYMTGGKMNDPDPPFGKPEKEPEQPDEFDRADFLHDDLLEEEWND